MLLLNRPLKDNKDRLTLALLEPTYLLLCNIYLEPAPQALATLILPDGSNISITTPPQHTAEEAIKKMEDTILAIHDTIAGWKL